MIWLKRGVRVLGLVLLVLLLATVDRDQLWQALTTADLRLLALSIALYIPHIMTKALRWRVILSFMGIPYRYRDAYLSYQGGIFIGLLTPGRLGELARAMHITKDCEADTSDALASVLLDRICDLVMLLLVGTMALLQFGMQGADVVVIASTILIIGVMIALGVWDRTFEPIRRRLFMLGRIGKWIAAEDSLPVRMRQRVLSLPSVAWVIAGALTLIAYGLFFLQCYLAARAFHLPISFVTASFATALGSLVALIPVSISGLGTRDAAIVAYLNSYGIPTARALSFSLAFFLVFYLVGGLIGALAWQLKPITLPDQRR